MNAKAAKPVRAEDPVDACRNVAAQMVAPLFLLRGMADGSIKGDGGYADVAVLDILNKLQTDLLASADLGDAEVKASRER